MLHDSYTKRSIIIDTDPGLDDALAILMAIGNPNLKVEALTVVAGNVTVDKCVLNARKILTLANETSVPIYRGAAKPMGDSWRTLEDVFGESGLAGADDVVPLEEVKVEEKSAVDYLVDYFSKPENKTTLCCIGPLTNVANAIKKSPGIVENIDDLVIMGGCISPDPVHQQMGNIQIPNSTEQAEFNFISDPEAASLVLSSPFKSIALVDLAITRAMLFNGTHYNKIDSIGNAVSTKINNMMLEYSRNVEDCYRSVKQRPEEPICAIHDAVAIGYILDPSTFQTFQSFLKVELCDPKKRGQTIITDRKDNGTTQQPITLIKSANQDQFYENVISSLAGFNNLKRRQHDKLNHIG